MTNFPIELFVIPRAGEAEFEKLVDFLDAQQEELLAFFPWFTAEMLSSFGAKNTVVFMAEHASKRLTLNQIFEQLPESGRFERIVCQNSTDSQYVELQSATGFFDVLRRYYIWKTLREPLSNIEIAINTGTSVRCVQRIRKKLMTSHIPHGNVHDGSTDLL